MNEKTSVEVEKGSFETLFTQEQIQQRVKELANQISFDYKDNNRDLIILGILMGAYAFTPDLEEKIQHPQKYIDYMRVSTYGMGDRDIENPTILMDSSIPLQGKDILIVEDIVDTGYSMETLLRILSSREPNSIKVCSLLSKPSQRVVEVPIDYLGFEIEDLWVVGYGLDDRGEGRTRRDIAYKKI